MKKRGFYIYQEDLASYRAKQEPVAISDMVRELNQTYCQPDMRRLRTQDITDYLCGRGYLAPDEGGRKRPTRKGRALGIETGFLTAKDGRRVEVNLYHTRAQQYILDRLYEML